MRYKSCRLLEHGIYFHLDPEYMKLCVGHCCNTDHLDFQHRLYLYSDLNNTLINWDYIFEEKRKLRENAKKGIFPYQCNGCFELQEKDWDNNDYINHITTGHILKCNSRCAYCPIGKIPECHNKEQDIDIKPIINELLVKNLLKFNGSLRFVGGEPTLMKEFDWLVELFSKNNVPEIYVPTSGIRLSKSLCNALQRVDSAAIVASIDAGTKKTFEKVKGTKFFDLVLRNMKIYLSNAKEKNFVIPKFILYTNYNDRAKEIEKLLCICKQIGFVELQFDAEHSVSSAEQCTNKKYVNRTIKMLEYTKMLGRKYNIKITSFLAFMNRTQQIYAKQKLFYYQNKDKYIDLYLDKKNKVINGNQYYSNLYIDINEVSLYEIIEKINKLIQNEKFSPTRKIFVKISRDIDSELKEKLMSFLRLGFDFDITIENFVDDEIIEEIIKTSYSTVNYQVSKKFFDLFKKNYLQKKYKSIEKLSNVVFC